MAETIQLNSPLRRMTNRSRRRILALTRLGSAAFYGRVLARMEALLGLNQETQIWCWRITFTSLPAPALRF
jgi:hypothetical protein